MEIEVKGKKYVVRELLAKEVDDIDFTNTKEANLKQVMLSTGISKEDYDKLTWQERTKIMIAINEVNGLADFQKPVR